MFPTAKNLQAIKLYDLSFACGKQLTIAMQLSELDIIAATKVVRHVTYIGYIYLTFFFSFSPEISSLFGGMTKKRLQGF